MPSLALLSDRSPGGRSPPRTPQRPLVHQGTDVGQYAEPPCKTSVRSVFLQKYQGRPGQCYEAVQKLGEGAFGVAHLVRDRRCSLLRVLKTINKRQSQVPHGQLEKEIRNLKACDHPHIIRLFEYYEDYENIYLVMEHAQGGELHQALEGQKRLNTNLPERWVCIVVRQCLLAISYVHSQGIIHKDLKCENILLLQVSDVNDPQSQPHAVIIDLGIAELFAARLGRRARCTVVAGTPTHMAPEVWRGNFGPVADVWSLGVVMFELLSGELPFCCSSLNSAQEWLRLHRQGPNWSLLGALCCSGQARAICQRMLNFDERMRPTAQQCLGHAWFKENEAAEAGEAEEAPGEDAVAAVASGGPPPLTSRMPPSEMVVEALGDYMGRSKFEKAVLLQVASQLHTAQMSRVTEVFAAADRDRSGTVSRDELVWALVNLGVERSDAESYAACVDVDGDAMIEYTELVSGCIGLLYESLRSLLWQSFCVIDVDGNGVLSREEVLAVVTRAELVQNGFPGVEPSAAVAETLDRMDVDNNGQISFDELCRHFLPRPSAGASQDQAVGGTLSQAAAGAMQDEEFAQLLDEIEAEHHQETAMGASIASLASSAEQRGAAAMGVSNRRGQLRSASPLLREALAAADDRGVLPEGALGGGGLSVGIGGSAVLDLTVELAAAGLHDDLRCAVSAELREPAADGELRCKLPDGARGGGRMTVDEELSHLLADIANGP